MIPHVTLQKFYEATKIPLQLFKDTEYLTDYGSGRFFPNPAQSMINIAEKTKNQICYTISPEYLYFGLIRIHNTSKHLIIGPTMTFECTQRQAEKILESIQQPKERAYELLRWLRNIPNCNLQRFLQILCFLDHIVNETTEHTPVHVQYETNTELSTIDFSGTWQVNQSDFLEKKILSYVEYGKSDALKDTLNEFNEPDEDLPKVSADAINSYKKIFVFATGIVSRAATKGGLDYNIALQLSDHYITKIDMFDHITDIWKFLKQMFLDFTERTAQARSLGSDSLIVKKICREIRTHLYDKITPTMIADRLEMNCSYLCRLFKQETGKTITEYIHEVKINESKRLLEITEMPLIQISTKLGFSSQNYFHTVFKKVTGMTPMEYKRKN